MLLGIYNYTVILTYFGMLTGYTGIIMALKGELHGALVCLLVAGICDMFDGKVASTKKDRTVQERRFGIQIDSLSDLICFGALPAVIIATVAASPVSYGLAGFYLLCGLIRLAWFNVDEEERQSNSAGTREIYYGLPITTSALLIPGLVGLGRMLDWPLELAGPAALLLIGCAFVTPFRLKKPALVGKLAMIACGVAVLVIVLMGVNV